MSNYFSYFPKTAHDLTKRGQTVQLTNILRRFKVSSDTAQRSDVYYKYDIQDGDRPDTIAEKYYGNANYSWLVTHFNDIEDVRFDWPLSTVDFRNYVIGKYGSISTAEAKVQEHRIYLSRIEAGAKVPATATTKYDGTRIQERVVVVDAATYATTSSSYQKAAVSAYDWELEKNESRRAINLIDKRYLGKIRDEVEDVLRNGV